MCAERLCKSGRSGDLRCAAELGECLHLDRVGVGQVLRQLVVELACHRLPPASFGARFPTGSLSHVATAFSPQFNLERSEYDIILEGAVCRLRLSTCVASR